MGFVCPESLGFKPVTRSQNISNAASFCQHPILNASRFHFSKKSGKWTPKGGHVRRTLSDPISNASRVVGPRMPLTSSYGVDCAPRHSRGDRQPCPFRGTYG